MVQGLDCCEKLDILFIIDESKRLVVVGTVVARQEKETRNYECAIGMDMTRFAPGRELVFPTKSGREAKSKSHCCSMNEKDMGEGLLRIGRWRSDCWPKIENCGSRI